MKMQYHKKCEDDKSDNFVAYFLKCVNKGGGTWKMKCNINKECDDDKSVNFVVNSLTCLE